MRLDPLNCGVVFEHDARYVDFVIFNYVDRFQCISAFLVAGAKVASNYFPASESPCVRVALHADYVTAIEAFIFVFVF